MSSTLYRLAWYEGDEVMYEILAPWTPFLSVVQGAADRLNKLHPEMRYFASPAGAGKEQDNGKETTSPDEG